MLVTVVVVLLATSCGPPPTPRPDAVGTAVAQAAFDLLTQTAAAASPTPLPPTDTPSPVPTETPTLAPTSSGPPGLAIVNKYAECWLGGPGSGYPLDGMISHTKEVELLGVGSESGWYIIRNPYFYKPCWISAADADPAPGTDLSVYPVMTPGMPIMGQ